MITMNINYREYNLNADENDGPLAKIFFTSDGVLQIRTSDFELNNFLNNAVQKIMAEHPKLPGMNLSMTSIQEIYEEISCNDPRYLFSLADFLNEHADDYKFNDITLSFFADDFVINPAVFDTPEVKKSPNIAKDNNDYNIAFFNTKELYKIVEICELSYKFGYVKFMDEVRKKSEEKGEAISRREGELILIDFLVSEKKLFYIDAKLPPVDFFARLKEAVPEIEYNIKYSSLGKGDRIQTCYDLKIDNFGEEISTVVDERLYGHFINKQINPLLSKHKKLKIMEMSLEVEHEERNILNLLVLSSDGYNQLRDSRYWFGY